MSLRLVSNDIDAQVSEAKRLVRNIKDIKPKALARLERDIRDAFARALAEVKTDRLAEECIRHFAGRKKWTVAKAENPNLTPLRHIEATYPDRREFGLCRSDFCDERLDPQLYRALAEWLRPKADGTRNEIPADFGLLKKSERTDLLVASMSDAIEAMARARESARVRKNQQRKYSQNHRQDRATLRSGPAS